METICLTPLSNAKSRFVYTNNDDPSHIFRNNLEKFELWNIKDQTLICELHIHAIGSDIQFQYAHYLHVNGTLLFVLATQSIDGIETCLYMMDPKHPLDFNRLLFDRTIKGNVSNIYISQKLTHSSEKEYQLMTIGTLDSALYVFRFLANNILTQKKTIPCTLARTDARNALTQEILVQADTKYVICGGSNGAMDFFLIKDDPDFSVAPVLEYKRPDFLDFPSKLPIVSIQHLKNIDKDNILLGVGQELFKPIRISRKIEPSMSLLKINIKDLICKDIMVLKFSIGTHLTPLRPNRDLYTLWTCLSESKELRITESILSKDKVVSTKNSFLDLPPKDIQQLYIKNESTCWMVNEDSLIKLTEKERVSAKRQRVK